jgi:hypothetical protein
LRGAKQKENFLPPRSQSKHKETMSLEEQDKAHRSSAALFFDALHLCGEEVGLVAGFRLREKAVHAVIRTHYSIDIAHSQHIRRIRQRRWRDNKNRSKRTL